MLLQCQHPYKGRAFVLPACGHNNAIVFFNDLPCVGQSNSGSFVSLSWMQPLENGKDLFGILVIKTNSIIGNGDATVFSTLSFSASIAQVPTNSFFTVFRSD